MPRASSSWWFAVLLAAILVATAPVLTRAQESATATGSPAARPPGRELLLQAAVGELPDVPAIVRLSRLAIAPGGSTTASGRAGPTFVLAEAGNLVAEVDAPAILLPAGAGSGATVTGTLPISPGDRLALTANTSLAFRNDGAETATALVAAILPATSAVALAATPDPSAGDPGTTDRILGEGLAATLPPDRAAVTLERFVLTTGLGVPAYPGPVLVAVEEGGFASTLDAGDVQLSAGGQPAVRPTVAAGESFAVRAGDAIFFPNGMEATPPLTGDRPLVLLRLGILPVAAATPTADTSVDAGVAVGTVVVVTENDVRLRAEPGVDGTILAGLAAGQQLVVTGPPVTASGVIWYPVQDPSNPALTGFVAAEFLAAP